MLVLAPAGNLDNPPYLRTTGSTCSAASGKVEAVAESQYVCQYVAFAQGADSTVARFTMKDGDGSTECGACCQCA